MSRSIVSNIEGNAQLRENRTLVNVFSEFFDNNAYLLYYNMCLNADSSRSAAEIFFPDPSDDDYEGNLTDKIALWQNDYFYFMDHLSYYMSSSDEADGVYTQSNLKSSEIIQAVQNFMGNGDSQTALDEAYEAYFCLKYLEDGSINFYNGKGEVGTQIFSELQTLNNSDKMLYYYMDTQSTDSLNAPRSMEVFYAFPTLDLQALGIGISDTRILFQRLRRR